MTGVVISADIVTFTDGTGPDHPVIGWRNLVTASTIAADTADSDFPATNLANPATHLKWQAADTTEQYVTVTFGSSQEVDYVGIARHNLYSAQVPVSIEGNSGSGWTELVPDVIPPGDGPLIFRFASQFLTGVRIRLQEGADSPTGPAEMAVVYVGKLLVVERRIYVGHTPMPQGRTSKVTNGMSESGNFLGRVVLQEAVKSSIPLSLLSPAWYRENMDPFMAQAKARPFFFAWRPQSYPYEVGYGWLTNDPMPVPTAPSNLITLSLEVSGVV